MTDFDLSTPRKIKQVVLSSIPPSRTDVIQAIEDLPEELFIGTDFRPEESWIYKISAAFDWSKTPQGVSYWINLIREG